MKHQSHMSEQTNSNNVRTLPKGMESQKDSPLDVGNLPEDTANKRRKRSTDAANRVSNLSEDTANKRRKRSANSVNRVSNLSEDTANKKT